MYIHICEFIDSSCQRISTWGSDASAGAPMQYLRNSSRGTWFAAPPARPSLASFLTMGSAEAFPL